MYRRSRRFREHARSHTVLRRLWLYPQSLLTHLWITCSRLSTPHANQALQLAVRKTTNLTDGFSLGFSVDKENTRRRLAPKVCWCFCG